MLISLLLTNISSLVISQELYLKSIKTSSPTTKTHTSLPFKPTSHPATKQIKKDIIYLNNIKTINRVKQKQKEWNKVNTKTYTYIAHATVLDGPPTLIFVQNNKVVKSLPLRGKNLFLVQNNKDERIVSSDFIISKIDNLKTTKEKLTKTNEVYQQATNVDFYLIDSRFEMFSDKNLFNQKNPNTIYPKKYKPTITNKYSFLVGFEIVYDKRYSYMRVFDGIETTYVLDHFPSFTFNQYEHFYSNALLMLPKNTIFDTKTIQKILFLYQKTYKCINQKDANETKCMYKNLKW